MKWTFYKDPSTNKWSHWRDNAVLIASKKEGGHFMTKLGQFIDTQSLNTHFRLDFCKGHKEITLREAIQLIDKVYRVTTFKKLGINISENPVVITDEIKNNILLILTKRRAFNGDSAHTFTENEFNNFEILDAMVEQGIIKTLDGQKYWLEQEEDKVEKNQLELKMDAKSTINGVIVNAIIMDEVPW